MRICHVTSAHSRYDARIFKRQCRTLADADNDVLLVSFDGKNNEIKDRVTIRSYSQHKYSKKDRFKLLFKNKKIINRLSSEDADIYQIHDIELIEIGRKLKNKGKKVIFDSHENWKGYLSKLLPNLSLIKWIYCLFFDFYYKKVISKFDAVFSVSPNIVESLKKYSNHVFMVSNFPSLKSEMPELRESEKKDFVYAGTVYDISNQINTVRSISLLSSQHEVNYRIIGKIDDNLKQDIIKNDIYSRVVFTNWVEKQELDKLLAESLAGIILLDYDPICCNKEGQLGSNKIFEYMSAGIPVICTDFKLWKELIIDKYKCGICVNPNSVSEIQEAMTYIIEHKEEARQMGIRGRDAVMQEFNWEKEIKSFVSIYKKIINDGN